MSRSELAPRQKKVFEFICRQIESRGYGPTIREIAEQFGIVSPNGVAGHLRALEKKGYIRRTAGKYRSIELSKDYVDENRGLPLAGIVAAGALNEAVESHDRVDFDRMLHRRNAYALRVTGDSMIEAHICDGDYVIVHPARTASAGDIAVVQTDEGDATLKYWFPERNRVRLQPANRRMKPIYSRSAQVIGVVRGVVRGLNGTHA
jgi:repressor LexA